MTKWVVSNDDLRVAEGLLEGDDPVMVVRNIALALAETRKRAEAPLRDDRDRLLRFVQSWVEEGYDRDEAIDVLATTDGPDFSDRMAAALTAAGYPVEAGPALVEALEWYADPQNWKSGERAGGTKEFVEWPAMADQGYRARTTLAQQHEPTS